MRAVQLRNEKSVLWIICSKSIQHDNQMNSSVNQRFQMPKKLIISQWLQKYDILRELSNIQNPLQSAKDVDFNIYSISVCVVVQYSRSINK